MKLLIWGPKARYDSFRPDFVSALPLEPVFCPREQPLSSMLPQHEDAELLFVDAIAQVDGSLMAQFPRLKLIHSEGVAYNGIDLEAARARNIFVCNNKGCNAAAVAEQAILLMLMLLRQGVTGDRAVREGRQIQMKEQVMVSNAPELGDCTVGLVGFGDIAQATAARLRPFGCPVFYYAPHRRPQALEEELGVSYLPLEELRARCDILCLLCAVTDSTREMVNDAFLKSMKPSALLINAARGDLVDNLALRRALMEGTIAGAGFDTLAPEPTPADHPLVDLPAEVRDRVVYSPHLGGITGSSFRRAHANMWRSAGLVAEGKRPNNVVNGL